MIPRGLFSEYIVAQDEFHLWMLRSQHPNSVVAQHGNMDVLELILDHVNAALQRTANSPTTGDRFIIRCLNILQFQCNVQLCLCQIHQNRNTESFDSVIGHCKTLVSLYPPTEYSEIGLYTAHAKSQAIYAMLQMRAQYQNIIDMTHFSRSIGRMSQTCCDEFRAFFNTDWNALPLEIGFFDSSDNDTWSIETERELASFIDGWVFAVLLSESNVDETVRLLKRLHFYLQSCKQRLDCFISRVEYGIYALTNIGKTVSASDGLDFDESYPAMIPHGYMQLFL